MFLPNWQTLPKKKKKRLKVLFIPADALQCFITVLPSRLWNKLTFLGKIVIDIAVGLFWQNEDSIWAESELDTLGTRILKKIANIDNDLFEHQMIEE